jgi:hypothetical protein
VQCVATHCITKLRSEVQQCFAVRSPAKHLIRVRQYTTVGTRENKKAGLNTYAFSWTGISLSLYERVARAARWDRVSFLAAPSGVDISSENQCEKRTTLRTDESAGGEQ